MQLSACRLFKVAGSFTERSPGQRDLTKAAEEIAALTSGQVQAGEVGHLIVYMLSFWCRSNVGRERFLGA